jgi:glycosyltransferase involved in cell wall biosynthesis
VDVFVLSSLVEGLSLSILEAMAAAKPVVVTDVGGNREIVVDGETGFIVPPKNPAAIAEKVCLLLNDRTLAEDMGKKGRQRVNSFFSKDTMIRNYQELYTRLAPDGQALNV